MARSKKLKTSTKIIIAGSVGFMAYMVYKFSRPLPEVNPNVIVNPNPSTLEVLATGLPNIFDSLSNLFKGRPQNPTLGYLNQVSPNTKSSNEKRHLAIV